MLATVERVDDVVRGARMLGPVLEDEERECPRLHLLANVGGVVTVHGDERERVLEEDLFA